MVSKQTRNAFQFYIVRLKGQMRAAGLNPDLQFQFYIVRLKA